MSVTDEIVTQIVDGRNLSFKRHLADGHYKVEGLLAAGGQGFQLICRDQRLAGNKVLIKVQLYPAEAFNRGKDYFIEQRNLRHRAVFKEVVLASQLNERVQNVPRFIDYFHDENINLYGEYVLPAGLGKWAIKPGDEEAKDIFVIYELLSQGEAPAETLSQFLKRRGKLTEEFVLRMAHQLLDVLWQLHEWEVDDKGEPYFYIYEDLKPENILVLGEQSYLLIDFGGLTRWTNGSTPGLDKFYTVGYAPQEMFEDANHLDQTFDIFSLGVTMFQCLTGIHPQKFVSQEDKAPTLDYSLLNGLQLEPLTIWLIRQATQFNRWSRFRSAKEMGREVERALAE